MSIGELLVTVAVALLVFDKKKWPMLATHAVKGYRIFQQWREKCMIILAQQWALCQLKDNEKKAQQADALYHPDDTQKPDVE